jgi:hypothetical protein
LYRSNVTKRGNFHRPSVSAAKGEARAGSKPGEL